MKSALRSFHSPKHLLFFLKPTHSLFRQFPLICRQIHLVNPRLFSALAPEPDSDSDSTKPLNTQNAPRVWTIYNAVTGDMVTQRVINSEARELGSKREPESTADNDLETEMVYGKLKNLSSGDSEKPHVKKGGSLTVRDIVGSKKKGKGIRVNWVCADCGHTEGQWWGACRECQSVGTVKRFSEGEK